MVFRLLFVLVGLSVVVGGVYTQVILLRLGLKIRHSNRERINKQWSGKLTTKQLKKLRDVVTGQQDMRDINTFLKIERSQLFIVGIGICLLILAAFGNYYWDR